MRACACSEFGSSGRCETYANPPLSSEESFRVIGVEVWKLAAEMSPRMMPFGADGRGSPSRAWLGEESDERCGPSEGYSEGYDDVHGGIATSAERQGSSAFLINLLETNRSV